MTSIQNGGYFWLKTNYRVYLCCLEFLSDFNYCTPTFSWAQALPRSPLKSPTSLVRRRKSRWRLSGRRCRSSLSRSFSTFQPSRNDQAKTSGRGVSLCQNLYLRPVRIVVPGVLTLTKDRRPRRSNTKDSRSQRSNTKDCRSRRTK